MSVDYSDAKRPVAFEPGPEAMRSALTLQEQRADLVHYAGVLGWRQIDVVDVDEAGS